MDITLLVSGASVGYIWGMTIVFLLWVSADIVLKIRQLQLLRKQ